MKIKDLMEDLKRLDPESTVYVRVEGKPSLALERGYYDVDGVKRGALYASDTAILMVER